MTNMIYFLALFVLFASAPDPAAAGPIAAAVAAINAFAASSAFAAFIVRIGVSLALTALSSAIQGKPKGPRAPGIRTDTTTSGGTNPQTFILGRTATAGNMACPPYSHPNEGNVPNEWLTYVVDVSDLPGCSLSRLMVSGEFVELEAAPVEDPNWQFRGMVEDDKHHLCVNWHDGTQTAADPWMLASYADHAERPWTADMVGRGLTYAVLSFRYNRKLFNQLPAVRFEVQGIPLYDPRRDSTVGGEGAQRWSEPETWAFTENPIVMIYNILRGIALPDGSVWGGRVQAEDLPLSNWFTAMNECDVQVQGDAEGNLVAQYRAGLEVKADDQPADVIDSLRNAASAELVEFGGIYKVRVGAPALPVFFFTDEDVVADRSQTLTPYPGLDGVHNAIHASYPDPAALWETRDAPPIYNAQWEAEDGGRQLVAQVDLPAVHSSYQVQQLMAAWIADERRFRRHGLTLPPAAMVLEPLDSCAWTSQREGYTSKVFEVGSLTDDLVSCLQTVALRERDAGDFVWDPSEVVLPFNPSPVVVVPSPRTVPGFDLRDHVLVDGESQARRVALRLVWDPLLLSADDVLEWRLQLADGTPVASGSETYLATGELIVTGGILPDTDYRARARVRALQGGSWTAWAEATTGSTRFSADDLSDAVWDTLRGEAEASVGSIVDVAIAPTEASILSAMEGLELRALDQLQGNLIAYQAGQQARRELAYVAQDVRAELSADRVASAQISTALGARIDGAEATLLDEIEVRASETEALSLSITATQARLENAEGELDAAASAIDAVTSRVTQAEGEIDAVSQAITSTQAALENAEDDLAAQAATLSQHTSRLTTAEGQISAQAQSLNSVSTTVGQHTAAIDEVATSVDGLQAEYVLRVSAGGVVGGMVIGAEAGDGGAATINVTFAATAFRVAAPNGEASANPFSVYTSPRVIDGILFPAGVYIENAYIGRAMIGRGQITDTLQSDNYAESGGVPTAGLKLDFKNGRILGAGTFISRPLKVASGSFQLTGSFGDGHVFRWVNTGIKVDNSASWGLLEAPIVAFASFGSGATAPSNFNPDEAFAHLAAKVKWGWRWNGFPGGAQPSDVQTRDPSTLVTAPWSGSGSQRVMLDIELETTQGVYFVNPTINWVVFQVT